MTGTTRHERTNRGGSRRGGTGGGGRRHELSRDVVISKALSFLLRHGADGEGIELDDGGWANLADVVSGFDRSVSSFSDWVAAFLSTALHISMEKLCTTDLKKALNLHRTDGKL